MEYFYLTTPQQNIWNLQKYYEGTAISNLCGAVFFKERRDSVLLQKAVRQVIRSQSSIRLRFCEGDRPMQYVSDETDGEIPVVAFRTRDEFDCYAERAVFDAMLTGLDARIIRVGNLTSRASDYKFQPNYKQNAFLTRVKAILEFDLFPDYLMPLYSEFPP